MRAFEASAVGARVGLVVAAGLLALVEWRFPAFLGDGFSEPAVFVLAIAACPIVLGFLLGLFTRKGGAIALGLTGLALGGMLAFLDLPTPSPAGVGAVALGCALVLFLVASHRSLSTRRASVVSGILVLLLVGAAVAAPGPARAPVTDRPKIFVYGLDAGTWTILDELFARDAMPNLRAVRDGGAAGILRSEVESHSPRVWTTIATGKLPAKHGVLDFFATQNQSLKTRRLWEMLQARGWSVGLFQWLVTWPPDPFDPFIVPAWMARGPETRPMELSFIKELEIAFQTGEFQEWLDKGEYLKAVTTVRNWGKQYLVHGLRLKTVLRVVELALADKAARATIAPFEKPGSTELQGLRGYATKRMVQLLLNGDVYVDLYRRHQPDFSCFIAYGTDNLAHKFWQYHFPDDFGIPHERAAPFSRLLTDYYEECDRLLGEIQALLPPQTTTAVVSDHGFTSRGHGGESHQREKRPRMNRIVNLLGFTEADVKTTSVATSGYLRAADPVRADEIYAKVVAFLDACVAAEGGAKAFAPRRVDSGELEVAVNLAAPFERDTPIDTPSGRMTFGDLAEIEDRTGNHSVDGIVLLRGPAVRKGFHLDGARLQDVTPTLLYLHDQPIAADMDGKVLLDAVDPDFREEHPVERIQSWDEEIPAPARDQSIEGDDSAWREYAKGIGYVEGGGEEEGGDKRPKPNDSDR